MPNILEYVGLERQKLFMKIGNQLNRTEDDNKKLYLNLISEELSELSEAYDNDKLNRPLKINSEELDAYADILVVILGYYSIGEIPDCLKIKSSDFIEKLNSYEYGAVNESELLTYLFTMSNLLNKMSSEESLSHVEIDKYIPNILFSVLVLLKIYNISVEEVMNEVFESNMSKFEIDSNGNYYAILREDGKILKGKGFKLPDFKKFIK